jgi:hypothetical protein
MLLIIRYRFCAYHVVFITLSPLDISGNHNTMPDFENSPYARIASNAEQIKEILNNPAASFWLKNALEAALRRDPLDAAKDAAILVNLLDQRALLHE